MSNITLYNVKGLTEVDTIQFASIVEREAFFANVSARLDINTGFYPPHYQNVIKLDVPIDAPYNYLSLVYGDKTYYYFINAIQYVNEDIIAISITMDTIITFMFDVDFIQSHITRASIKRWNNDDINRNYLRENFSAGKFKQTYKKYFRATYDFDNDEGGEALGHDVTGTIVFKSLFENNNYQLYDVNNQELYSDNKLECIFVIANSLDYNVNNGTQILQELAAQAVTNLSRVEQVTQAYYLPFNCTSVVYENQIFDVGNDWVQSGSAFRGLITAKPSLPIYTYEYSVGFRKSVAGDIFSAALCPVLLDEVYTRVQFGEGVTTATYPLHLLTEDLIRCNYFGDISSGQRIYYLTADSVDSEIVNSQDSRFAIVDGFNTLVVAQNPIYLDIISEGFQHYYTYNKASTWASIGSAAISIAGIVAALL